MAVVGSGEYLYQVIEDWARLPTGWSLKEVCGIAVDSSDHVYILNRGSHPVIVFDRNGTFLTSWGDGTFTRPHCARMGPDETIYLTDDGDHTVRQCALDGRVLLTIGTSGQPAPRQSGMPFNRCTDIAIAPDGTLYISDGYGNSRIHQFTHDGRLLFSWGGPGTDPGEFNVPHNLCIDDDGHIYVADRENHRIQVFDVAGRFQCQWNNLYRPCGLLLDPRERLLYVSELCPSLPVSEGIPNLGARIGVYTLQGERLARLGDRLPGPGPGQFVAPHAVAMHSAGDLYVGEVSWTIRGRFMDPPQELRCLQKLVRVRSLVSSPKVGAEESV